MAWVIRNIKRDVQIAKEIDRQEDRGAAIVAGAYLEDFILEALKRRLVPDTAVLNEFFTGMGPLATFSAKIEMAYLMRLVDKENRQRMHAIRRIRNEFAHNMEPVTFETTRIKEMCKTLMHRRIIESFVRRASQKFKDDTDMLAFIEKVFIPMGKVADTARNSYINTVKVHIFYLEMGYEA